MRSLTSCLFVILIGVLFFFAAFFQTWQVASELSMQPTTAPVWATFPGSAVTPYVTQAIYQPFEHGFMLWRGDFNCVYAIITDVPESPHFAIIPQAIPTPTDGTNYAYSYCLLTAPLTNRFVLLVPPPGLRLPTGILGEVWNYYDEIRTGLGYATAPEQHYTATVPTNEGAAVMDGSPFTLAQMTLPDGTIFACGSRGATVGTCELFR